MAITNEEFEKANQRGLAKKAAYPVAISVRYDRRVSRIVIALSSGLEIAFSPKLAQGLENAHPADFANPEISPSGFGIRFPVIDADLYLPALLDGFLGSKRWMASESGKLGGAKSSAAKTAAARENGKLGGRPKKNKNLLVA
jgi:hypothetical protein